MALVRDNLNEIRAMFPDLDMEDFLNARLHQVADAVVGFILENQQNWNKKRKRTHDKINASDHEDTLALSDSTMTDVFDEEVDFSNPAISSFFNALANHFEQVAQTQQAETLSVQQISELISFFSRKFTQVRMQTFRWMVTKECNLEAILVILFFVENHAINAQSFNQILQSVIALRSRRDSVGSSAANVIMAKLEPLIKSRKFDANYQIKENTLSRLVDEAIGAFEVLLLRLLKAETAKDSKPFEGIRWMGKTILDHFVDSLFNKETFECMVCFAEYSITKAFYCTQTESIGAKAVRKDIHPFCLECVRGQAEASTTEALLSEGALGLRCMASDCKNPILFSNIRLYLPRNLRGRLEKRITNQAICSAGLSNLEFCLRCDFAMVLEDPKGVNKVFQCQNCDYSFCRLCEEEWKGHFGLSCDELKEKSEDAKRRELEKKLNEAVVRCCPKCHLQFVKLEACNKMTCRCGTTQCYICREVGIAYDHFCNHVRDPNRPNRKCEECKVTRCLLWEDFKKHDREAVERILKETDVNVDVPGSPQPGTSQPGFVPRHPPPVRVLHAPPAPHLFFRPPTPPRRAALDLQHAQQMLRQMHAAMRQPQPQRPAINLNNIPLPVPNIRPPPPVEPQNRFNI